MTERQRDTEEKRVSDRASGCSLDNRHRPGGRWERSSVEKRNSLLGGAVCDPVVGKAPLKRRA